MTGFLSIDIRGWLLRKQYSLQMSSYRLITYFSLEDLLSSLSNYKTAVNQASGTLILLIITFRKTRVGTSKQSRLFCKYTL